MSKTAKKEKGRIITTSGMGGFLNPPTHPEHTHHVETGLRRRPENRGGMALSAAVEAEWLDDATRAAARTVLASWQRPTLESPEAQDWIRNVLGYFVGCYRGKDAKAGSEWDVHNLIMTRERNPLDYVDDHAGVNLIRKYYPEFVPTAQHFQEAYWGKKPE